MVSIYSAYFIRYQVILNSGKVLVHSSGVTRYHDLKCLQMEKPHVYMRSLWLRQENLGLFEGI